MAFLTQRGRALLRTHAPARRFGGHGHGDGKYTFDRATDMGSPRQKYHLNYDMRKLWCPEFMRGPSVPPVYPNLEPEMAIARDWHSYRPIKEAWLMFGLGIGGLFGLAAVSTYDLTGYRARRPWVMRSDTMPPAYSHTALQNLEHKVLEVEAADTDDDAAGGDDDY